MKHSWIVFFCLLLSISSTIGLVHSDEPVDVAFFEKHIRPVLVDKCYECHAASTEISGGLALDSQPGWQRGGDSGPAIEPGKPESSRLVKALEYEDSQFKMPPDGKLPAETIEHFKRWIAAGAIDPRDTETATKPKQVGLPVEKAQEHWSYRPLAQPKTPEIQWSHQDRQNSIDAFIEAEIAEQGLETSAPAEDRALLRRLTFDLHGLPPSEQTLQAYVEDTSPDKYERQVDRLLASPRFGERMARHWMDVARYAESVTLRGFVLPQAWRYRDYLIAAFNEDRPIDLFVREQIAGDLMDANDLQQRTQQIVATALLAMGNTNLEEQDKTQLEMDYIDEQLEVVGRVFMGQTLGCARCHDHKFDPIPTRDYYALAGIFRAAKTMEHENVSKWIERPLPMPSADATHFTSLEKRLTEVKATETALEKSAGKKPSAAKKGQVQVSDLPGIVIDDVSAQKVGQWKESTTIGPFVGASYIHDLQDRSTSKSITFEPKQLPPGNYTVRISYTAAANRTSKALVRVFSADGEKTIIINQREEPTIDGLWVSLGDYRFEKDGQAFVLLTNEEADGHVVADAVQFLPVDEATQVAAKTAPAPAATVDAASADATAQAKQHEAELKKLKAERTRLESELSARPKALSLEEKLPAKDIPVHIRGNIHNLGSVVPRGFLQCAQFSQPEAFGPERSGRLELAQWLTDPRHPLVPRVLANRLWLWTFGTGLVRTADNFGTTGEAPSHPALLDFMATELMRRGWSGKELMRQMVLSSAYRRSVQATERSAELDPENRMLSHAVRKRVEVEALRDAMLSLSGELSVPAAGSTLKPGVKEDYRYKFEPNLRAVYQPVLRNSLPELYEAFDFPNSSISTGQRSQSVVSPQALALMNNAWVHQRAVHTAERLMNEIDLLKNETLSKTDWQSIVDQLFARGLGREPTSIERYTVQALIDELSDQGKTREQILTRTVHGLFASLDFRYLE